MSAQVVHADLARLEHHHSEGQRLAALTRQHAEAALQHATEAGRILLSIKASMPHGTWLPWLKANVSFSERTAERYMHRAAPAKSVSLSNSPARRITMANKARLAHLDVAQRADELIARVNFIITALPEMSVTRPADRDALLALRARIDEALS